jgi:hypothetical protein
LPSLSSVTAPEARWWRAPAQSLMLTLIILIGVFGRSRRATGLLLLAAAVAAWIEHTFDTHDSQISFNNCG